MAASSLYEFTRKEKIMIRFQRVSKIYPDGTKAVHNLNFTIEKGEFFVLIGPSGSGKTTTLKMINRLIDLTEGTIFIQGKKASDYDIHELRWNIGYVLQQIALFPHMTIAENIAIVPELKKWKQEKIKKRIDELLEMVGLDPATYRDRMPHELSGGQQQRIGVIRALAANPDIILMDEPFSALDPISREKLQDDMLTLQRQINKTIVFVTHDMHEALKLGDRICVMQNAEAVQIDTPEQLIQHPVNAFVKNFVRSGNGHYEHQHIEDLLAWMKPAADEAKTVSSHTTIQEALALLADEDAVAVEKDGEIVGTMTRQVLVKYLASRMGERQYQ